MLNSQNLPQGVPQEKIREIAEALGVPREEFHNLVRITISTSHVEFLWEDMYEVDHLHRARIIK